MALNVSTITAVGNMGVPIELQVVADQLEIGEAMSSGSMFLSVKFYDKTREASLPAAATTGKVISGSDKSMASAGEGTSVTKENSDSNASHLTFRTSRKQFGVNYLATFLSGRRAQRRRAGRGPAAVAA